MVVSSRDRLILISIVIRISRKSRIALCLCIESHCCGKDVVTSTGIYVRFHGTIRGLATEKNCKLLLNIALSSIQ